MTRFRIGAALFLCEFSIALVSSTPGVAIREKFLLQFINKLAQPASLEIWGKRTLAHDPLNVITRLADFNLTFVHHGHLEPSNIYKHGERVMFGSSSCKIRSYMWVDILEITEITKHLESLSYLCPNTNFILNGTSILKQIPASELFCSSILLIWSPEKNGAVVGFPEKSTNPSGCFKWRFYDDTTFNALHPFRIPWLGDVSPPCPSLRGAVIRATCFFNCDISNSFVILSNVRNFTISDCYGDALSCEFFEIPSKHVARTFILTEGMIGLPLDTFKSQSLAFLAPKGTLYPKWKYLVWPFSLDVGVWFLVTFATLICFFVVIRKWQISHSRSLQTPLYRLAEFLVCSLFAPVSIPRGAPILSMLLLTWGLLMQIPACGFRAILTSCLNEPPRRQPISALTELSGKLGTYADPMLLCVEDPNPQNAISVIVHNKEEEFAALNEEDMRSTKRFMDTLSSKTRNSECLSYVRNETGVFLGNEDSVTAAAQSDGTIAPNQFTRMEYLPDFAFVYLHSPYRRSLSQSLLWLSESHVEHHLNTLRYIKEKRTFTQRNHQNPCPHAVEDLSAFIQLWIFGLFAATMVLIFENLVFRLNVNSI